MESIVTFQDPLLEDVRYVVHLATPFRPARWFRLEGDVHTALTYVPDPTPPREQGEA